MIVAGAGWSGAVIARTLADAGYTVDVYDTRPHVGGNCYTERRDGITVHVYGPHIFHTNNRTVWDWVQRWAEWVPYRLTVRSTAQGHVYPLPVNLHTINQIHGTCVPPRAAATLLDLGAGGDTFEAAAIGAVGERIYRLLFEGYTHKQWGVAPSELPASVFKRLPVRFNYDDSYFDHPWQAIPRHGYTEVFERILTHPRIRVHLNTAAPTDGEHVFWTGSVDAFHGYRHGRLGYRTLDFQHIHADGDWQGVALMNHPDIEVPWTRSTEHKHLAPWETHQRTIVTREHPDECAPGDIPMYPKRLPGDLDMMAAYQNEPVDRVTFAGRLGTYRYIDMDQTIADALTIATRFLGGT